jgi:hypothetical protein
MNTEPPKASIHTLPNWKKGSTEVEWFQEFAAMAMEHPTRFARVVVIYEEVNAEGMPIKTRMQSRGIADNTSMLGTLAVAQDDLLDHMKGRTR